VNRPAHEPVQFPVRVCAACSIVAPKPEPRVLTRCPRKMVEVRDVAGLLGQREGQAMNVEAEDRALTTRYRIGEP
jgi:hypothetical protein